MSLFGELVTAHCEGRHEDLCRLAALDSVRWMREHWVAFHRGATVLDLACGNGSFGRHLKTLGCDVTFVDHALHPNVEGEKFLKLDLNKVNFAELGAYDMVICSNFLEHLHARESFFAAIPHMLKSGGHCYLAWTPWLSPYGGHEYSPWHYLGKSVANRVYRGPRWFTLADIHSPAPSGNTLYPSFVGPTLRRLRKLSGVYIRAVAPRYYTGWSWIMRVPVLREFACWNCAVLIQKP